MGQKVCPIGLRLNITEEPRSKWFAASKREYANFVIEDFRIRELIKKEYGKAGISRIYIERSRDRIDVYIHTANPGLLIGKRGSGIDALTAEIEKMTNKKVNLRIIGISKPELDAQLIAESIALQLERRMPHRRVMHKAADTAIAEGALGIKIMVSGRIAGAEIARHETIVQGKVPLQTFRAIIDYGFAESDTTKGRIGVKVWLYKGEKTEVSEEQASSK